MQEDAKGKAKRWGTSSQWLGGATQSISRRLTQKALRVLRQEIDPGLIANSTDLAMSKLVFIFTTLGPRTKVCDLHVKSDEQFIRRLDTAAKRILAEKMDESPHFDSMFKLNMRLTNVDQIAAEQDPPWNPEWDVFFVAPPPKKKARTAELAIEAQPVPRQTNRSDKQTHRPRPPPPRVFYSV